MGCPYLQETAVVSCRHARVRAQVPSGGAGLCGTPEYTSCALWREHVSEAEPRCPYLAEERMQFCAAAAVRKFVPPNDAFRPRCAGGGYRYCALYLDAAGPSAGPEEVVDGIRVPVRLYYSPNHMWIEVREDGGCHLGIDGFLARTLQHVEQVGFLTTEGQSHPAVVVTARGMDVQVAFPNPLHIAAANRYLRADPDRLLRYPYSLGWLFEGCEEPGSPVCAGLIEGRDAPAWMRYEVERMRHYPRPRGREELLRMMHDFFSPLASREVEA